MVNLDSIGIFIKVAELLSFTQAAKQLGMPKARVSWHIRRLEEEVGATLLQRSTRRVSLTAEGAQFLARARRLNQEADDLTSMFQAGRSVRGRVRIDVPVGLGRDVVMPRLSELLTRYPALDAVVSATDRRVEAFREGFDCLLRVGDVGDGELVGRRLGRFEMVNCASPQYLGRFGVPRSLEDLAAHSLVHYSSTLGAEQPSFEYVLSNEVHSLPMRSRVTVNNADAYQAACCAGLGLIQVPRIGVHAKLAAGALVEVMPGFRCAPMPVTLLHTHGRTPPRRVRAAMNWLAEVVTPFVDAQQPSGVVDR